MDNHGQEETQGSEAVPLQPDVPRIGKVVIEVLGGVAVVTSKPDNVEVEIIDHDNEEQSACDRVVEPADRLREASVTGGPCTT